MYDCIHVLISVTIQFSFFFQAEDGIRDVERSRGLGDVYKRQLLHLFIFPLFLDFESVGGWNHLGEMEAIKGFRSPCIVYRDNFHFKR